MALAYRQCERAGQAKKASRVSREWQRAPAATLCGGCRNRTIEQNGPALYITIPGVKRPRVRCQNCAGEAPPDLPANLEPGGIAPSKIKFSRAGDHAPARTRGALRGMAERYTPHNS